jgi:hypothetical protein
MGTSGSSCSISRDWLSVSVGLVGGGGGGPGRGRISGMSRKSAARLARYLASARARYRYFGTLTFGATWPQSGPELKDILDRYFRRFMRRQYSVAEQLGDAGRESLCWFLEFQARGAPHVHFFFTHFVPWQDSARAWSEVVGDPEIEQTATKFEFIRGGTRAIVAYARKYATKGAGIIPDPGESRAELIERLKSAGDKRYQKVVPEQFEDVGRFWGVRGWSDRMSATISLSLSNGGAEMLKEIKDVLDRALDEGKVNKVPWTEGAGHCYYAVGADLYSSGVGQEIDRRIQVWVASCEHVLNDVDHGDFQDAWEMP